jgi:prefoldin subunit 5
MTHQTESIEAARKRLEDKYGNASPALLGFDAAVAIIQAKVEAMTKLGVEVGMHFAVERDKLRTSRENLRAALKKYKTQSASAQDLDLAAKNALEADDKLFKEKV